MEHRPTGFRPYAPLTKAQWPLIQPGTLILHWLKYAERHVSRRFALQLKTYDLIASEWVVLREMYKPWLTSPLALARAVGMSKGGLSKLIDRLVDSGLVRKTVDRFDRRRRVLELTEAGEMVVGWVASEEYMADWNCFRHFGSELRETLAKALKLIAGRSRPRPWTQFAWGSE